MTKQQLAQKRNYFKFVLTGLPKSIDLKALTGPEQRHWKEILKLRNSLLKDFEFRSYVMGLNTKTYGTKRNTRE